MTSHLLERHRMSARFARFRVFVRVGVVNVGAELVLVTRVLLGRLLSLHRHA